MTASDWLYMALLVTATALTRSTLVLLGSRISLPPRIDSALRYAPACALSAILLPPLLTTAPGPAHRLAGQRATLGGGRHHGGHVAEPQHVAGHRLWNGRLLAVPGDRCASLRSEFGIGRLYSY